VEKIDWQRFDEFMKDIDWAFDLPVGKEVRRFPLTDISHDENTLYIDIAVAGFGKNDIDIEIEGDTLVISGSQEQEDTNREYTQRHISVSSFERKIKLNPDFVNGDIQARYNNGLLNIEISRKEKPKQLIEIQ